MWAGHQNKMFHVRKRQTNSFWRPSWCHSEISQNEGIPVWSSIVAICIPFEQVKENSHKRASLRWLHMCLGLFRARISSLPHLCDLPATSMAFPATSVALPAEAGSLAYTQAMAEPSSPREGRPGWWLAGPCYLAGLAGEGSCPWVWFTAWALNPSPCSARNTTSSRKEWLEPVSWQWGITPPTDLDGIQPKPPSSRNESAGFLRIYLKVPLGDTALPVSWLILAPKPRRTVPWRAGRHFLACKASCFPTNS